MPCPTDSILHDAFTSTVHAAITTARDNCYASMPIYCQLFATLKYTFNRLAGLTEMWGTPTHYSPELINKTYGPQSDMWSLGCMMYEMLTGEEAFPS